MEVSIDGLVSKIKDAVRNNRTVKISDHKGTLVRELAYSEGVNTSYLRGLATRVINGFSGVKIHYPSTPAVNYGLPVN